MALIAGILVAAVSHYVLETDEEVILGKVIELQDIAQTKPLPVNFIKQTQFSKRILGYSVPDIAIYDELARKDTPIAQGQDNLLRYMYVILRNFEFSELELNDIQVKLQGANRATVTLVVDYSLYYRIGSIADGVTPLEIDFVNTSGEWLIESARRLDVFE